MPQTIYPDFECIRALTRELDAPLIQILSYEHKYGQFKVVWTNDENWTLRSPIALTHHSALNQHSPVDAYV